MKKYKKENKRNKNGIKKDRNAKTVLQKKLQLNDKNRKKKEDIVEKWKRDMEAVKKKTKSKWKMNNKNIKKIKFVLIC